MQQMTHHPLWSVAAAAVIALGFPAAASAQQRIDPVRVVVSNTRADELDARATAYEQSGDTRLVGKAAGMREKAAELRAPDDPRGFTSLRTAAHLRYGRGQKLAASSLMERAADHASGRGDVYNAAEAYILAAIVNSELRSADPVHVRALVDRGTLLMTSPLLSAPQRESLRGRIAQLAPRTDAEVAVAAKP